MQYVPKGVAVSFVLRRPSTSLRKQENYGYASFIYLRAMKENGKICISSLNEINIVPISDIVRCESRSNYTTIHLTDGKKLIASKPLCDFEEMLAEYSFCRVHNSHLVNMAFVKSFRKNNGYHITLHDGTDVAVSTRRKDVFLQKLKEISCAIF